MLLSSLFSLFRIFCFVLRSLFLIGFMLAGHSFLFSFLLAAVLLFLPFPQIFQIILNGLFNLQVFGFRAIRIGISFQAVSIHISLLELFFRLLNNRGIFLINGLL